MVKYDYIIVGAGAAGLMMAYRMAKDSFFADKTILILDKEKKTQNDRTWCFWEQNKGEWDDILNHSWSKIHFASDSYSSKENITPYKYKMIRGEDFYQKIWKSLENKPNITFRKEPVCEILQEEKFAKVITSKNTYFSKNIINSILFSDAYKKQLKYPVLQQHFVGFFIKTKENYFDNSIATFMDFSVEQKENTRFMYVLPYKKNEALFEYTLFSADLLPYDEYKVGIEKYLLEKGITDYEIIEKEQGSIPMTSYEFWKMNSENIINIGTSGGWSKASTGFTFKNIDKKTVELIHHLKQENSLETFHQKTKFWLYDLLLLDILAQKNYLGASIFSKMFKNIAPQKIFKFLDEETTIIEEIQIFSKMQKRLFSKALIMRIF
ncbi:lycopene cyclase family protein [Polaribacter vadi]|uniref:lycopene cyclase family protein n=1 Tax=Polaribacter vadi TaxID=1774273 RepID=UPI0030ED6D82|tara:strand:- start:30954 stop:32093 length:1140 start_codon:yes stop_codon:yes gene_type:complete